MLVHYCASFINFSRDISNPPLLHLTSRKPLWRESEPADINS